MVTKHFHGDRKEKGMRIARPLSLMLVGCLSLLVHFAPAWAGAGTPQEIQAVLSAKTLPARLDVVGLVKARNPSKGAFVLADRAACSDCQGKGCAPALLPVRWAGTLPGIAEAVRVKGTVRDTKEGKFLFAESVEKVAK